METKMREACCITGNKCVKKHISLLAALSMLILSTLACAERYFTNTTVYASVSGQASDFYDEAAGRILQDDVWVFRPDGTYSALLSPEGQRVTLAGKYGGDNVGHDFIFSIDTDGDGIYDNSLYASEDFSYIEWRRDSGTIRYYLAP